MAISSLLSQLKQSLSHLPKAERQVAMLVLCNPAAFPYKTIDCVIRETQTSAPTVLRFCRRLGCDGFAQFKLQLAQAVAAGTPYIHEQVNPHDSTAELITKLCTHTQEALGIMADSVEAEPLEAAIDVLQQAGKIDLYGAGASGAVALDAQHKFFRLDVPTTAYIDPHSQLMSAAGLRPNDAAIAISYRGRSRDIVHAAEVAGQRGAAVIGITTHDTPLVRHCRIAILLPLLEDTTLYTPMLSRICQLLIIDILATGIALRRGRDFAAHLQTLKASIDYLFVSDNDSKEANRKKT